MNRREYVSIAALVVAGSFAGGALSTRLFSTPAVLAQSLPHPKTFSAESFILLDADGKKQGEIASSRSGGEIRLLDADGVKRVELSAQGDMRVFDRNGQPIWSAPARLRMLPAGGKP
ncbi:MAG: hypothetical protein ACR2I2_22630 [Bryobacteraceae bacterium]